MSRPPVARDASGDVAAVREHDHAAPTTVEETARLEPRAAVSAPPRRRTWQPDHWVLLNCGTNDDPCWIFCCAACDGCAGRCDACLAAWGDPQPDDFNVVNVVEACTEAERYLSGEVELEDTIPSVLGVHRCRCGRWYGTYRAGGACFVAAAPGYAQVDDCVRCGRPLQERAASVDVMQLSLEEG